MDALERLDDVGTLYESFYDQKRTSLKVPETGQVVYCPVLEIDNRLKIAKVERVDSHSHVQVQMHIRDQQNDDFRGKEERLPVKGLNLDLSHELVLSRAKLRPCLVVGCCAGVDASTVQEGQQRRLATNAFNPTYLLAPMFSVSSGQEPGVFGPVMTARIKCLMYPELFYLRQSGGYLKIHSIARLDRIFVRAPHPGSGFELTDLFVAPEIMGLALEQLRFLAGQPFSKEYLELREMMLSFLPKEALAPAANSAAAPVQPVH